MFLEAMSLTGSTGTDGCTVLEESIGRLPYGPGESFAFNWSRRSLVTLSSKRHSQTDRKWHADHMMYLRLDKNAGLARNNYLKQL